MKRSLLSFSCCLLLCTAFGQMDTLYLQDKKITCRIMEIGDYEIRYTLPDNLERPVYIISADKVYKYVLSNGKEYTVVAGERDKRPGNAKLTAIKVYPFSYIINQIGIAVETVLRRGTNLDVDGGYINNSIIPNSTLGSVLGADGGNAFMSGFYIKPGFKFIFGLDRAEVVSDENPLKGGFVLINAAFTHMQYENVLLHQESVPDHSNTPGSSTQYQTTTSIGQLNCFGYGGLINFGYQMVAGVITVEYYAGVGATAQFTSTSISDIQTTQTSISTPTRDVSTDVKNLSNYHGFFRMPSAGLSGTLGLRIGFILPKKNSRKR